MITIYSSEIKHITQDLYNSYIDSIHFNSLKCPKCKHHQFVKHGYYDRTLKFQNRTIRLRILRIKCLSCNSTHAILLYFIVPYSQYALEVHLQIVRSKHAKDFMSWVDWKEDISEFTFYYIRSQYYRFWHQRILAEKIPIDSDLINRCFNCFSLQFMQIKCSPNIFCTPIHIS